MVRHGQAAAATGFSIVLVCFRRKLAAPDAACIWTGSFAAAWDAPALNSGGIVGGYSLLGPAEAGLGIENMFIAVFGTVGTGFVFTPLLCFIQWPAAVLTGHARLPFFSFMATIIADLKKRYKNFEPL